MVFVELKRDRVEFELLQGKMLVSSSVPERNEL